MTSNPTSIRGMITVLILPFSHLAYLLPRFGQENKEREEDGWPWLRKYMLW